VASGVCGSDLARCGPANALRTAGGVGGHPGSPEPQWAPSLDRTKGILVVRVFVPARGNKRRDVLAGIPARAGTALGTPHS
jgi:hypothetical protein